MKEVSNILNNIDFNKITNKIDLFIVTNSIYKTINNMHKNKLIEINQIIYIDKKINLFEKYILKYFKNKHK